MPGIPRTGGPAAPVQFTHGLRASFAPPNPLVLTGCTTDKNGRLVITAIESGGAPTSYIIERSPDGVTGFTDISSNCFFVGIGTGASTTYDLRPNYAANGAAAIPIGSPGFYRAKAVGGGFTSAYSNVVSAVSNYDRSAVEVDIYTNFSIRMGTNATEHDGNCGWAYPGYQWLVASYAACLLPSVRTQALIDLQDWWNTSKTHLNADGLYQWETTPAVPAGYANSSSAFVMGWQYNVEFGNYALVCARLLNSWLPGDPTATAIATDMRTKANTLGKAMIDKFATYTVTDQRGYGGNWPTVAGATAWAAFQSISTDSIRRPSVANGRMYRLLSAASATGSVEPTWPTTDRGTVTDAQGNIWQDCTNDNPLWTAGATVPAGMIYRPSTPNNRTYRAMNAGTTHASTEPTWPTTNGGTVTDNGITWKETSATANIFYGYYDKTTYAATNSTCVTDFLYETAAFFTALMADANLPDFQSGSYKTAATTLANDALNLGATAQVGAGAVVENLGVHGGDLTPQYDTYYLGFIGHSAALINYNQHDTLSLLITKRLADWFDSDFGVEPHISNKGQPDGLAGPFDRAELGWRQTVFTRSGRVWNLMSLLWDSSTQPANVGNYTQSGLAPTPDLADGNFPLVALAIDASLALHLAGNQATETDTATAVTHAKGRTVTQAAETDTATAVHSPTRVAQATETDTATAVTHPKTVHVSQASETDTAQAVGKAKAKAVTQASETDSASAVTPLKTLRPGQAIEVDTGQAMVRLKVRSVSQANETDSAQPLTASRTGHTAQASETDSALPVSHLKGHAALQASETDSALSVTHSRTFRVGQVIELDTASGVTRVRVTAVGQALETDTGLPVTVGGSVVVSHGPGTRGYAHSGSPGRAVQGSPGDASLGQSGQVGTIG